MIKKKKKEIQIYRTIYKIKKCIIDGANRWIITFLLNIIHRTKCIYYFYQRHVNYSANLIVTQTLKKFLKFIFTTVRMQTLKLNEKANFHIFITFVVWTAVADSECRERRKCSREKIVPLYFNMSTSGKKKTDEDEFPAYFEGFKTFREPNIPKLYVTYPVTPIARHVINIGKTY